MNTKDPSAYLRSIFWFQDRLLTGGLNGQICEWDLSRLEEKKTHDSMGGPIWNMSLSSGWKFLAIACEDGSVRVFRTKDDDGDDTMDYYRSFAGQPCRVLSVAWHPNEKDLFSGGSDGTIRRFDVFGRNQLSSIKVESIKKDPPMIWSLAVLKYLVVYSYLLLVTLQ